jgi:hypothetical protein
MDSLAQYNLPLPEELNPVDQQSSRVFLKYLAIPVADKLPSCKL